VKRIERNKTCESVCVYKQLHFAQTTPHTTTAATYRASSSACASPMPSVALVTTHVDTHRRTQHTLHTYTHTHTHTHTHTRQQPQPTVPVPPRRRDRCRRWLR
jgi:hypothetical protein